MGDREINGSIMMSDDAFVILVTKNPDRDESEFEYRVGYSDNIEKLYGIFDSITGKWKGDNGIILDLFAEQIVFTDLDEAVEHAQECISLTDTPEFGIVVMKDFQSKYFYDL
jgi:hypothetical protein